MHHCEPANSPPSVRENPSQSAIYASVCHLCNMLGICLQYVFGSLISRRNTYHLLVDVWKQVNVFICYRRLSVNVKLSFTTTLCPCDPLVVLFPCGRETERCSNRTNRRSVFMSRQSRILRLSWCRFASDGSVTSQTNQSNLFSRNHIGSLKLTCSLAFCPPQTTWRSPRGRKWHSWIRQIESAS